MVIVVSLSFISVLAMYITTTNWVAAAYPVFTTLLSNNSNDGTSTVEVAKLTLLISPKVSYKGLFIIK